MIRIHTQARDVGETLIEILIAIMILGVSATGLIAGLSSGIVASGQHRHFSSGETLLRAYGELVKDQVVHPPTTTVTQALDAYSNGNCPDNVSTAGGKCLIPVASTAGFDQTHTYTIQIDGVLWSATVSDATTFAGSPLGAGEAGNGATVQRFEACPDASYWAPITTDNPGDSALHAMYHKELTTAPGLATPVVSAVTFYNYSSTPIASCSSYYNSPGNTFCANTTNQWTRCEPPWMRVTISVSATDGNSSRTTDVIIRRVP